MKSFLSSLHKLDRSLLRRTKTISQKGFQRAQFGLRIAVAGLTYSLGLFAMTKPSEAATTTLSFDKIPTLVSGTARTQGAVYRFSSVATGTDAMVEIQTIQNAQLKNLDDNASFPARFQPVIAPAAVALTNATSYVKFNFKLTPSSTPSGTSFAAAPAATATNVYFSSQDTDGNGGTNTIREFVEVSGALTSYIANPTLLQPSTSIAGGTGYEVANSLNVQSGVGTDDRYEVYSFLGESVSTFSIIGGNKTGSTGCTLNNIGCDRQNSWTFNVADVQKLDFGDAPLVFGNAFHPVPPAPTVRLGASVDGDDGPSYTAAADGDGADDNGVASFPTLTTATTSYSLNLTCAGNNASVAGWIDFNKNNTFDAGERSATGTCNGTNVTLNWSGISGLTIGNTYARFRISSTASEVINPTGQASNGEVEDYQVSISAPPQVVGFKSAKLTDSNNDTKINPGETVNWTIDYVNTGTVDVTNFQIADLLPIGVTKSGAVTLSVGGTGQASPTVNSSYTGTNTTIGTTDTLFTAPITLKVGGMIKVTIPVTINSGISGILSNQSTATATNLPTVGIKTDNAGVTADLPTNIQNSPYSVSVPTASISQTITTAIDSTKITVEAVVAPPATSFKSKINLCGILNFDTNSEGFRAATITYSSSSPSSYNGFTISPQSAPYPTSSPLFNWQSSGNPGGSIFTNDLDGNWTIFTTPDFGTDTDFSFLNSKSFTFDYKNDTGISGAYDFWVALVGKNGQKVFYSFKTQLSGASTTAFSKVVVPMDATKWFTTFQSPTSTPPTSAAFANILTNLDRIDIAAEGKDGPDLTELDSVGMACDRGDAPDTYGTLAAANGPSHQIISALKLGNKTDAENDGQPTLNANGDDQDLSASNRIGVIDDEDGITAFPALTAGGTAYSIPAANITAVNTTGAVATLHAWIDFDRNGTFEATEYTSTTINTSSAATGPLSWTTGFTVGSSGSTFARFRLTKDVSITASTPRGSAIDGEVEDYQVAITTAVVSNPNVLLVKRITAVNGNTTNGNISLNSYDPETDSSNPAYPYDKNVIQSSITPPNSDKWPNTSGTPLGSTFLIGARNGGTIKPNDTVEYTIYFLSTGDNAARKVTICDRVPTNMIFIPNSFNGGTADPLGLSTADRGIAIERSGVQKSYTNINDGDIARYYPPNEQLPSGCKVKATDLLPPLNPNGTVVVKFDNDIPNATTFGELGTYGLIRFRTQVK